MHDTGVITATPFAPQDLQEECIIKFDMLYAI